MVPYEFNVFTGTLDLVGSSGGGGGVTSLDSLTGALTLAAGTNTIITPSGSTITIGNILPPGAVVHTGSGAPASTSHSANPSWSNLTNFSLIGGGTRLSKTTGNGTFDAFAYSATQFNEGPISVTVTPCAGTSPVAVGMIGLSQSTAIVSPTYASMDYAIDCRDGAVGDWAIYESGTLITSGTASPANNKAEVSSDGTTVTYLVNSTLVYTSLVAATGKTLYATAAGKTNSTGVQSGVFEQPWNITYLTYVGNDGDLYIDKTGGGVYQKGAGIYTLLGYIAIGSAPTAVTIGTIDSQTASADGLVAAANVVYAQSASATDPGMVNIGAQTIAGSKTFLGNDVGPSFVVQASPSDTSNVIAEFKNTSGTLTSYIQTNGQGFFNQGFINANQFGVDGGVNFGYLGGGSREIISFNDGNNHHIVLVQTDKTTQAYDVGLLAIKNNFASNNLLGMRGTAGQTGSYIQCLDNSLAPVFMVDATGNIIASAIGAGLIVAEGTNAKMGTAVLNGTTAVTVATTAVTANSRIFLTIQASGGVVGSPYVDTRTSGTSFNIKSVTVGDTSTVAWMIVEPA